MDWLEKLPELLKMSWSDLAKALFGVTLFGTTLLGWSRSAIKRARERAAAEEEKARLKGVAADAQVETAKAQADKAVAEAKEQAHLDTVAQANRHVADMAAVQQAVVDLRRSEMKVTAERDEATKLLTALQTRIGLLESFDGKLWDRELLAEPPKFVSAVTRKTRFVAIANLKGGVGKTTVAADAGAMLAKRGKRVLLVDLDFQGSLTRLCIGYTALRDLVKKGETVSALFGPPTGTAEEWLARVIRPVVGFPEAQLAGHPADAAAAGSGSGVLDFIAAFDDLADVELREEVRWFVTRKTDVRFAFRRLMHAPAILDRYDYVFFDCPPRLTTASVNALACADGLVIPATLDQQSIQAIPRTLRWLQRLPQVSHARLWGLVANQVKFFNGKPTAASQEGLNALPDYIKRSGHDVGGAFLATVRADATIIAKHTGEGRIPALAGDADPLFIDLVTRIEQRATL